jgi:hypothetical protein
MTVQVMNLQGRDLFWMDPLNQEFKPSHHENQTNGPNQITSFINTLESS